MALRNGHYIWLAPNHLCHVKIPFTAHERLAWCSSNGKEVNPHLISKSDWRKNDIGNKQVKEMQSQFDALAKRMPNENIEFWFARDLQELLGYDSWTNFSIAIRRAINTYDLIVGQQIIFIAS